MPSSDQLKLKLMVRGAVQKKTSIYKDIIHIEVDPPPSHPIFDKNYEILGCETYIHYYLITF